MPRFLLVFYDNPEFIGTGAGDAVRGANDISDIVKAIIDEAMRHKYADIYDLRGQKRELAETVYLYEIREELKEMFREFLRDEGWAREQNTD